MTTHSFLPDTKPGILAEERMKGYREGLGQINQVACDEAYSEGLIEGLRLEGWERTRRSALWFLLGVGTTVLIYELNGALL